jgi:transcription antitermination factor NusG
MIWYALRIPSGYDIGKRRARELSVAEELRADGYTVMLPCQKVIKHQRNSRGLVTTRESFVPLVHSYAFCDTPATNHRLVRGVLMIGGRPHPIPHRQFARMLAEEQLDRQVGDVPKFLTIGQVVKLTGTAFDDHHVTIAKLDKSGRVTVSFQLFGKNNDVVVNREQIAA